LLKLMTASNEARYSVIKAPFRKVVSS
jgi:hypothetical protein